MIPNRLREVWRTHWDAVILAAMMFVFVGYFGANNALRHERYQTGHIDLGMMDQIVWNTAHGRIFRMTQPYGTEEVSRLSIHSDVLLVLLAPLYWVWPSPHILLMVLAVGLALGALPLFWLARDVLDGRGSALLVAFAYLMYPPIQGVAIFDFLPFSLAAPVLLWAFWCAHQKNWGWFAVWAVLALTLKENLALDVAAMGLWIAIAQKERKAGLITAGAGLIVFCVLMWGVLPRFRDAEGMHFAMRYYANLGSTWGEVMVNIATKPHLWMHGFWDHTRLEYLTRLFIPLGFLPLASAVSLMALPELLTHLLSQAPWMRSTFLHYPSGVTPFLFIGTVFALRGLKNRFASDRFFHVAMGILTALTLWSVWRWSPLPGMKNAKTQPWTIPHGYARELKDLERMIPPDASVSATYKLAPHFSQRREIFLFPRGIGKAEYIVTQRGDYFRPNTGDEVDRAIAALESDRRYEWILNEGPLKVFKKVPSLEN